MFSFRKSILVAGSLFAFAMLPTPSYAAPHWLKGSTQEEIQKLADIQPGLGTVMIEYSRRFGAAYYAAKGGNWGMAQYQIKEMPEIQEVGEMTRPQFATMLKSFESSYLDKLMAAAKAKDWNAFKAVADKTPAACNGCHAANGYDFIKYELPASSPSPTANNP